MNHRYSQRMNDMLLKVFQVGANWHENKKYPTFEAACIDKYNVAHNRTDGQEVWDAVNDRVNTDQKIRSVV